MPQARDEAGNIWETDAQGNPVRLIQQADQGQVFTLPPDPMEQQQAQLRQNADARAQAQLDLARQAAARAASEQNKPPAGYRWNAQGGLEPIPGGPSDPATLQAATKPSLTAKERADAISGYNSASQLDSIIRQLETQYRAGPGATSGISGIRDYLPTEANRQFDSTANAARGIIGSALGFTGGQLNTATEAEQAIGPYLPQAGDRDQVIQDKIARLKELADSARTRSVAILGGVPDANGRITPVQEDRRDSVWQQTYIQGAGPGNAAPPGSGMQQLQTPPAMQAELQSYIQQNAGNMDPNALRSYIDGLYQKYGFAPNPANAQWAQEAAQAANQGGTINPNIPGPTVPLSGVDAFRNTLVNNPLGAAGVGFTDAASLGAVSALAGDQVNALGNASGGNTLGMTLGQIGGSIAGTRGLGALGRNTIGRAAPAMMAPGGAAAREVATDALYSGIYGAAQGQDPLLSAGLGAGGSIVGRGLGRATGAAIGGLDVSAAAQALRNRGIPLTVGQTLGGFAKSAEDALTSAPVIGDIVNARRLEGLREFNRQAMGEGVAPIGGQASSIGEAGLNDLQRQVGDAYSRATAGANVPFDPQFTTDLANVAAASRRLPPDYQAAFDTIGENRIGPLLQRGSMTGEDYQQAMRGLKSARSSAGSVGSTGFEPEYRDALSQAMSALEGNMMRGGGQSVVEGLSAANAANRNVSTIEDAMRRAAGGSTSGENFVFTPSQLQRAGMATETKYPGARPFADLADTGQEVLPSRIPDSGTARRAAQLMLPGALGGTGVGIGALAGGQEGAQTGGLTGLGLAAMLALGGTKSGQKVLNDILVRRPDSAKAVGQALKSRRGMFGSAAVPLVLPIGQ